MVSPPGLVLLFLLHLLTEGSATRASNGSSSSTRTEWTVKRRYTFSSMDQVRRDWKIVVRAPGATNDELQAYVEDPSTAFVRNESLVIRAARAGDGFISARLHSKLTFSPVEVPGKKLRVEFVARVPTAKGGWPALWLRGLLETYGPSPYCGEIDLMEWVWNVRNQVSGALHWKEKSNYSIKYRNLNISEVNTTFITYGVEYSAVPGDEYIQLYVSPQDGNVYYGPKANSSVWRDTFEACHGWYTPGALRCSPLAPFDNSMILIMNIAVGGSWGSMGVGNDYSALDKGIEMEVTSVTVFEN